MTYNWQVNLSGWWGFDTGGGDGLNLQIGTKTPLTSGFRLYRPPAGLGPGHFVLFSIIFFDSLDNIATYTDPVDLTTFGQIDLYDPDYIGVVGSSGHIDTTGFIDPPPGAVSYTLGINDTGPYDLTGTNTLVAPNYAPYTDENTAIAQAIAPQPVTNRYAQHPILDVRTWLLNELYASTVLNMADYAIADPLVPIQQLPETNDSMGDKAFIVYDMQDLKHFGDDYWIKRQSVTLSIYSPNYMKVLEIQNLLIDLMDRADLTARDINAFNLSSNKFLLFEVIGSIPPAPAREENGRYGGSIVVEYEYTRSIGNNGRINA